jgi:catechol 2,3-dioxygenase
VAGFQEVYRQPDVMASFVSNGNTYHDVGLTDVQAPYAAKGQGPGLYHYAFELANEVQLVQGYKRAVDAGVKFVATKDHDVAHSLYLKDPDGLYFELYADVVKDWRTARRGIVSGKKPQWTPGVTTVPVEEHRYPVDPEIEIVRDAVFHPKRTTHVGVVAADYETMFDFYTRIVGLVPLLGGAGSDYAVLHGSHGSYAMTLYRQRKGLEPGFHHVGFEVWDEADLDRAVAAAPKADVRVERVVDHPARKSVCILDPDGIRLQFYVNRNWTPQSIATVDAASAPYLL